MTVATYTAVILALVMLSSSAESFSAKANVAYVSRPASDAAGQIGKPVQYPRDLYPEIEPLEEGFLDVGDGHCLAYDVSGNPDGIPAVFLHGGPGAGVSPRVRRFFDPEKYKIVIFDQRGSGKSIPMRPMTWMGPLWKILRPSWWRILINCGVTYRSRSGVWYWAGPGEVRWR